MLRCSWQFLNDDPKNQFVITPHFRRQLDINDPTSDVDAQALVDDLWAALNTWYSSSALTVTAYNDEGAKPRYPLARKKPATVTPLGNYGIPELAVCLSFYGTLNRPRQRGRLYIPHAFLGALSDLAKEVPAGMITRAEALVPIFSALGGSNVDWGVWSPTSHLFHRATNYWVDNAWDIQRSRGVPPTTKVVKSTSG
jgi:hypothetical protein